MKKILIVLLMGITILSFTGCNKNDDSSSHSEDSVTATTEQNDIETELTEIETALGDLANDYLNFDITDEEAEAKLDILDARSEVLSKKIDEESEKFYNSDRFNKIDPIANFSQPEMVYQKRYFGVSSDILSFKFALGDSDDKIDIVEIRDEYYNK